jgi:hypothetical protein
MFRRGIVVVSIVIGACNGASKDNEDNLPITDGDPVDTSTGETSMGATLRIEPAEILLTTTLDGTSTSATIKAFENDKEVTASYTLGDPSIATIDGSTVGKAKHGGVTTITGRTPTASGDAVLKVKLIGDSFVAPADATTKAAFDGATLKADPTKAPAIEYPLDKAIVPRNVPPMEVQWSATDATQWRVHFQTKDTLDLVVYSKTREALLPSAAWSIVTESAAGEEVTITVDGLGPSGLYASAPVTVKVARDRIDDTSIFYWESSSGSMKVLDFATGKLAPLPVTGSAWAPGDPTKCVACHTVSRDGTRFAYTNGDISLGTLVANKEKTSFVASIEPGTTVNTKDFRWSHGVFNPVEASTRAALLVTKADRVANNAAGHVRLALIDPETGVDIPSNLTEWLAAFPPGYPRDLLQPDWSNAGVVVFNAYDTEMPNPDPTGMPAKAYVRLLGDDSVGGSIMEATVSYDAASKKFTFGAPKYLVKAKVGASLDVTESNTLPQISPDESLVAFARFDGWWPVKYQDPAVINITGRVLVVRRSDGAVIELANANGPPKSDVTQPQWAPTVGVDYAWLAFSAERPYGHRMNASIPRPSSCFAGTGMTLCKNMWITAIDRKKAAMGTADPSNIPFWMPGQTALASAVSPRWTKTAIKVAK